MACPCQRNREVFNPSFRVRYIVLTIQGRKRLSSEALVEDSDPKPAKKPRKPKAYIPAYRSGGYALIIALASLPRDSLQSLTKAELQELAQEHSDSSFTVPSEAGKFYTAWNSMNTLVDKFLVHERGRPTRRYTLTDEGWELADKIKGAQGQGNGLIEGVVAQKPQKRKPRAEPAVTSHTGGGQGGTQDLQNELGEYQDHFVYPDHAGMVRNVLAGDSRNTTGQGHRSESEGHGIARSLEGTATREKTLSAFIDLLSSPESAKPRQTKAANPPRLPPPPTFSRVEGGQKGPRDASLENLDTSIPFFEPIEIQPGSFSVRLIVDRREVRDKAETVDHIQKELSKRGIGCLSRSLEVGDFFWVAKLHDPNFLSRYGEEGDELALDWVIERKRLDDLIHSIIDRRFQEQKFRLRKSGVRNVSYLVEKYTLDEEMKTKYHDHMQTAIASTQVVDGYFLKWTEKLDESIDYVARMTRMLKSLYESKPLYLIPTNILNQDTYLPILNQVRSKSTRSYHVTYPSFASLSSKSDSLTLKDVFLKMLMCTRGISGEKALAIQKYWPTPRALLDAFEHCQSQNQKDALVESRCGGHFGVAKIKGKMSEKVATIWGEA